MSDPIKGSLLPVNTSIAKTATIDPRVVLAGDGIFVHDHVRLDAACIIGEGVTIGQGAWVRAGAVVLRSVPANAIGVVISIAVIRKKLSQNGKQNFLMSAVNYEKT